MTSDAENTTVLLQQLRDGDETAAHRLLPILYDQFHALAENYLRKEPPGHTLQPTALVHEAFMKLVHQDRVDWRGRTHFFAVGAQVMRRILVDHARTRQRQKRGGGMPRIELTDDLILSNRRDEDVLAVDQALMDLAEVDPVQAKIVELRFFGGLTVEEVAKSMGKSKRTIEAEWAMARAWLRRELSEDPLP